MIKTWIGENGKKQASLVKFPTDDPDWGLPLQLPDLSDLGPGPEFERDIHNELIDRGLFTWADIQAQQNGVTVAVKKVAAIHNVSEAARPITREIISRYRSVKNG